MQIVHVAPITRGVLKNELTYFTSQKLSIGSLINVPIRGKKTPALVVRTEDASDIKSKIKTSHYSIKKITDASFRILFLPEFLEAVYDTSEYFAMTIGQTI